MNTAGETPRKHIVGPGDELQARIDEVVHAAGHLNRLLAEIHGARDVRIELELDNYSRSEVVGAEDRSATGPQIRLVAWRQAGRVSP